MAKRGTYRGHKTAIKGEELLTVAGIKQRLGQLAELTRGVSDELELKALKAEQIILDKLHALIVDESRDADLDALIDANDRLEEQLNTKQGAGAQRETMAPPLRVCSGAETNSG